MGLWDHRCLFASKDGSADGDGSEHNPFDLRSLLENMGRCLMRIEISRSTVPTSGYWTLSDIGIVSVPIYYDDDLVTIAAKLQQWCDDVSDLEFVNVQGGPYGVDVLRIDLVAPYDEWQTSIKEYGMDPYGQLSVSYDVLQIKCKGAIKSGAYNPMDMGIMPCMVAGGNLLKNEIHELIGYDERFDVYTETGDLDGLKVLDGAKELGKYESVFVAGFLSSGAEVLSNSDFTEWMNGDLIGWTVSGEDELNSVSQDVDGAKILSQGGQLSIGQDITAAGTVRIDLNVVVNSGAIRLKVRLCDGTIKSISGFIAANGPRSFYCRDVDQIIIQNVSSCDIVVLSCHAYKMDGPRGSYDWYGEFESGGDDEPGYVNGVRLYRSQDVFKCADGVSRHWALWYAGLSGTNYEWRLTPENCIGQQSQEGWYWKGEAESWASLFYPSERGRMGSCLGESMAAPTVGHTSRLPVFDGWGSDMSMFDVAGAWNLRFRNLHITNMQTAGEGSVVSSDWGSSVEFAGCAFTCVARAISSGSSFVILRLEGCYLDAVSKHHVVNLQSNGMTDVRDCILNVRQDQHAVRPTGSVIFEGNLVLNAGRVLHPVGICGLVCVRDNTIVNATECLITMSQLCKVLENGNILVNVARVFWWTQTNEPGTLLSSRTSCLFNGAYAVSDDPAVYVPDLPTDYCSGDPKLLNFVPQNRDLIWPYEMGAIKRGYRFPTKSRPANMGRFSIMK